jgi:hypothetical protein
VMAGLFNRKKFTFLGHRWVIFPSYSTTIMSIRLMVTIIL